MREKKSEFMGQFRVTPGQKAKIRAMLKFYQRDRRQMAFEVMDALFYHCDHKDQLAFPLRFVVVPKDPSDTAVQCVSGSSHHRSMRLIGL